MRSFNIQIESVLIFLNFILYLRLIIELLYEEKNLLVPRNNSEIYLVWEMNAPFLLVPPPLSPPPPPRKPLKDIPIPPTPTLPPKKALKRCHSGLSYWRTGEI